MKIRLPYKKYTLQSALSPKEASHRLLTSIEPLDKVPFFSEEAKWYGKIDNNHFMIKKI
jgi:hypothetical protein